jgi:hypothetical protein
MNGLIESVCETTTFRAAGKLRAGKLAQSRVPDPCDLHGRWAAERDEIIEVRLRLEKMDDTQLLESSHEGNNFLVRSVGAHVKLFANKCREFVEG